MKKLMKNGFRLAATTALVCAMASGTATAKDRDGTWVIAVSLQTQQERAWSIWVDQMEAEAERQNARLIIQYAQRDPAKQASQVEQLLAQQPDAFIFNPVNSATAGPLVDTIKDEGIPVVAFDDVVLHSATDYLVIRDNYTVGVMTAKAALAQVPEGNYAFIKGSPAWNGFEKVVQGYEDTLGSVEGVKIVFDQNAEWDPSEAQALTENAMTANQDDIDAFIVMNDGMATGVVAALTSKNVVGDVFVSGMDAETQALQNVATGNQTLTVYTDFADYSATAVKAAVMLANGETPEAETMTTTPAGEIPTHLVKVMEVNSDNLCNFVKNDAVEGWTSIKEVFGTDDC